MHSISYYRDEDPEKSNCVITDQPLVVNCIGIFNTKLNFTTSVRDGRRDFYLLYLTTGSLYVSLCGHNFRLTQGSWVLIPPETPYLYTHRGEEELEYQWIHFTGNEARELCDKLSLPFCTPIPLGPDDRFVSSHAAIQNEFLTRDTCFDLACGSLLTGILIRIARKAGMQPAPPFHPVVRACMSYLHQHYDRTVSLQELSEISKLSISRLRTLFKSDTGLSPNQYLIRLRMQQARRLLANSFIPVSEVGRMVGYDDPLYFSRLYKKHFGFSPKFSKP